MRKRSSGGACSLVNRLIEWGAFTVAAVCLVASAPAAQTFFFSTGDPDGRMATASRPESTGKVEIESADDFNLPSATTINQATFTGLLPAGLSLGGVSSVTVEIYRVFPNDSANPPDGHVPTRVNSPSDVAFLTRDNSSGLSFTTTLLSSSFTANNSVLNGINAIPNQKTGGEGAVTGQEVRFSINFTDPLHLPADHYFFIPQVQLTSGDFFWLSAPKPIVSPGTPFTPDLQSWIRNGPLDPDWLRVGTDIVGGSIDIPAPTFNAAFSLTGIVPETPSTIGLLGLVSCLLVWGTRRWRAA